MHARRTSLVLIPQCLGGCVWHMDIRVGDWRIRFGDLNIRVRAGRMIGIGIRKWGAVGWVEG